LRLLAAVVACALTLAVAASASNPPSGASVGDVTIYPLAADRIATGLTFGNDGNLWISEAMHQGETQTPIAVISRNGAPRASFGITPTAALRIVGPDGNFWLAGSHGRQGFAVKLTPSRVVTAYPTPTLQPETMVSGPDGNVYFSFGSGVYRVTTDGVVTLLASVSEDDTGGLAVGADGNLWLREWHPDNAIARITLDGVVTVFPLNDVFESDPQGVAAGPDGNIWTTERRRNRIARVTPDGTITEFKVPRADAWPNDIVAGSDGNLWFKETGNGTTTPMLGRITPNGAITEYPLPSGLQDLYVGLLTPGSDGNVWFGSIDSTGVQGVVGRISVADPAVAYAISRDGGFAPAASSLTLGRTLQWTFYGPSVHEVADATGLGLFDSGPKSIVSSFRTSLGAAGVYSYADPLHPSLTGTITVPPAASPTSGGATTGFTITWATAAPASGRVFDVQLLRPGASGYVKWMTGTAATSAVFTPDAGPGRYVFRARLRDTNTGAKTGYAAKSISVS
jgi:streptogramin lyase/plastocyanin